MDIHGRQAKREPGAGRAARRQHPWHDGAHWRASRRLWRVAASVQLPSLARCREHARRWLILASLLLVCLPALVCGQEEQVPFDVLQMKIQSLDERINPCKDPNGATYTTSRLEDRCMETERIIIDGQRRLFAICQEQDTSGVTPSRSCPAGTCRSELVKEVFPDPSGLETLIEEANFYIFKQKRAIRECVFGSEVQHLRNEDFVAEVQDRLYGQGQPGMCGLIADRLCSALGGDPTAMTERPASECCALSELPNSWTLESPELFKVIPPSPFPRGSRRELSRQRPVFSLS